MSASTDLAMMLNLCIEEREELRELNAELVGQLRTCADMFEDMGYPKTEAAIRRTIAKAEALK